MKRHSIVAQAQKIQLFGISGPPYMSGPPWATSAASRSYASFNPSAPMHGYGAVDASKGPYDLTTPGAVSEIKLALKALGRLLSTLNPQVTGGLLASSSDLELVWQSIDETDPNWDDETAVEFALMVSRYRSGAPWALRDPFMQDAPYPSKPQPAVNGLELLAGAVNTYAPTAKMKIYETWRGGVFAPPSIVSRPDAASPVTPTPFVQPNTLVASDAPDAIKGAVGALDAILKGLVAEMLVAPDEASRKKLAETFMRTSSDREQAILAGNDASSAQAAAETDCLDSGGVWDPTTLTCVVAKPPAPVATASSASSLLPLVAVVGLVGLGVYFVVKD